MKNTQDDIAAFQKWKKAKKQQAFQPAAMLILFFTLLHVAWSQGMPLTTLSIFMAIPIAWVPLLARQAALDKKMMIIIERFLNEDPESAQLLQIYERKLDPVAYLTRVVQEHSKAAGKK